jgi:hypothetical protein
MLSGCRCCQVVVVVGLSLLSGCRVIGLSWFRMVHWFITKNTFEEKINDMIQKKKALAEITVATGENWIGNLSNKELREII